MGYCSIKWDNAQEALSGTPGISYLLNVHLFNKNLLNMYCVPSSTLSSVEFAGSPAGKESACSAGDPCSTPGSEISSGKGIGYPLQYSGASLVAQTVKNLLLRDTNLGGTQSLHFSNDPKWFRCKWWPTDHFGLEIIPILKEKLRIFF